MSPVRVALDKPYSFMVLELLTSLATAAITFTSAVRCARRKKKAIPAPMPNSTVEDTMCVSVWS